MKITSMNDAKKAPHTPTPWKVRGGLDPAFVVGSDPETSIALTEMIDNSRQDNMANAAFIVRACNAHDELVALIDQAASYGNFVQADREPTEWLVRANRILAQVRGC